MKRKTSLTAVILTMLLLAGCGETDHDEIQRPTVEYVQKDHLEEDHAGEYSGDEHPDGEQAEGQQTHHSESHHVNTDSEVQNQTDAGIEFTFEDVSDRIFYFSSGAGGWSTELVINSDGTFQGQFHDTDMGDSADTYPNGTIYFCEFTGMFSNIEKIDAVTYRIRMNSLVSEQEPEKEEIMDGVRYIYSTAYGLEGGEYFYLYLPGAKLADLPEEYLRWVGYYNLENTTETTLPYYGLYNLNMEEGFSSYVYEKQSLSEEIAMEISFAEERGAELEAKLQADTTQLDMNATGEELLKTWDDTLNIVWKLLEAELDDATMEALRAEERTWIAFKDEAVKAAGEECEGGSMQALTESLKAVELTKARVYELAKYAE